MNSSSHATHPRRTLNSAPMMPLLLVVDVLRQTFEFFQKDECAMRRYLEALPARLTDEVVIHADQVVLRFPKQDTIVVVGARRDLRLLRAAQPLDRIVVGTTATRTLKLGRSLLRLFGEKLTFVHARSVPH